MLSWDSCCTAVSGLQVLFPLQTRTHGQEVWKPTFLSSTLRINTALPYPLMGAAAVRKSKVKRQVLPDAVDERKKFKLSFYPGSKELRNLVRCMCLKIELSWNVLCIIYDGSLFKKGEGGVKIWSWNKRDSQHCLSFFLLSFCDKVLSCDVEHKRWKKSQGEPHIKTVFVLSLPSLFIMYCMCMHWHTLSRAAGWLQPWMVLGLQEEDRDGEELGVLVVGPCALRPAGGWATSASLSPLYWFLLLHSAEGSS